MTSKVYVALRVKASPDVVWKTIGSYEKYPKWISSVDEIEVPASVDAVYWQSLLPPDGAPTAGTGDLLIALLLAGALLVALLAFLWRRRAA